MGHFSALYAAVVQEGIPRESPVYFIDNAKEELMRTGTWLPSSRTHFYLPGYDSNLLVEYIQENSDVKEIKVISNQVITVREMYMHFLLHIN
jgi:hypothetical protein